MKKLFMLLAVVNFGILCIQAQTQNRSKITGIVKNGEKVIEAATVTLLSAKDSGVVKIEVTDKNGKFEIVSPENGSFLLLISSVGFEKKYTPSFTVFSGGTIQTGTTVLKAQSRI